MDVGHVIEIRADFSHTGRAYQPFPDPLSYRISLEQLRDEKTRERLKLIWEKPLELDPSKRSAEVTQDVAKYLAELAKSFEKQNHPPKAVAEFLTRCLFCMFAEDVGFGIVGRRRYRTPRPPSPHAVNGGHVIGPHVVFGELPKSERQILLRIT